MAFLHAKIRDVFETGRLMRRIGTAFSGDTRPYLHMGLNGFFEHVRKIPYHKDPVNMEFLQRPTVTLKSQGPGGDCDDKAICMLAFCRESGITAKILAAGRFHGYPLHHTWIQGYIDGEWQDLDPTYAWNSIGERIGKWEREVLIG